VRGVLGHVSARVSETEILIRCRGPRERGLHSTSADDIWRVDLDGRPVDVPDGYAVPKELPLHTEVYRARSDVGSVVHAHPRSAVLCTLAGLTPRPVFGAYDIPAMRMALERIPVYDRSVLISTAELATEMVSVMESSDVCLLRGHGVTVAGPTVEAAVVTTDALDTLLRLTVDLARLGAEPPAVPPEDLDALPDLGRGFNHGLAWNAMLAEVDGPA
jgi:3,4-dihydroxyphthalate decarboxylase